VSTLLRGFGVGLLLAVLGGGCSGGVVGQERGRDLCFDGFDNDSDGLVDCDDPYCKIHCEEKCLDTVDNDGDGLNGCEDPKCAGQKCFTPIEICDRAGDEDGNGSEDCEDPSCIKTAKCLAEVPEICDNRFDDNGNLLVDCKDPECREDPACPYERCGNGVDDDANGDVDCDDAACNAACRKPELCTGGLDEDEDGAVDCADSNCKNDVACIQGCRVRFQRDFALSVTEYQDSCPSDQVCVCSGAPACPTMNPDVWDYLGDFVGVSELCGLPPTCDQGGTCRAVQGRYTLRLKSAGLVVDDLFDEPELYVTVNGARITDVQNSYDIDCDDCYTEIDVGANPAVDVRLIDEDILSTPIGDADHSDTIADCQFFLDAATLKKRMLTCKENGGSVELTLEPHP
jgi:hypothetical protein